MYYTHPGCQTSIFGENRAYCIRDFTVHMYVQCVSEKRQPFYFCDNFVRCRLILLTLGRNIPAGICSMTVLTC